MTQAVEGLERVTAHCVVRYMQYVHGIHPDEVEGVRPNGNRDINILKAVRLTHPGLEEQILSTLYTERNRKLLDFINNGEIRLGNLTLVIAEHHIVTLYPTHNPRDLLMRKNRGRGKTVRRRNLLYTLKTGNYDEHTE